MAIFFFFYGIVGRWWWLYIVFILFGLRHLLASRYLNLNLNLLVIYLATLMLQKFLKQYYIKEMTIQNLNPKLTTDILLGKNIMEYLMAMVIPEFQFNLNLIHIVMAFSGLSLRRSQFMPCMLDLILLVGLNWFTAQGVA